ncbi:MAG: hypothetical protein ACI4MQ_02515 [Candidatus Coproplasma sp.]
MEELKITPRNEQDIEKLSNFLNKELETGNFNFLIKNAEKNGDVWYLTAYIYAACAGYLFDSRLPYILAYNTIKEFIEKLRENHKL